MRSHTHTHTTRRYVSDAADDEEDIETHLYMLRLFKLLRTCDLLHERSGENDIEDKENTPLSV